ncbi:hypothetical protein [Labilibaculum euxinus]|uniref:HNH endonuclease n=1 Tax=Labilibaculum euxinus TaxID=2686357 RepID=A0A7M4DAY0_9BACT|nr:hypothetical protein [Labilibaculum euxinus]MUP39809.1 hypothetical protein [Labilibaculum euxinus]MVB09014.1 hypothetical protein [Labilibaculum euxinus]
MPICKLCKQEKPLIKKSHIIPDFLHKELYDRNHRIKKFNAKGFKLGLTRISEPPTGEYEGGLLCKECDGEVLGKYETYLGKILSDSDMPEEQKPICSKIINENGVEFLEINNVDYKLLKLSLLSILWRADISTRKTFQEVKLGPYEEKIRKQLIEENPSNDNDIEIAVLSWRNDKKMATDVIGQPRLHKKNGKTYYSIIINGYIVLYFISENSIDKNFKSFRLKDDNTLSIVNLPRGYGMEFLLNYTGAIESEK